MVKKYYAVRKGHKTGIFTEWLECEKQIKGYSGAEYRSFHKQCEAKNYLNNSKVKNDTLNNIDKQNIAGLQIYVNGSYADNIKCAGYGYIVVEDNKEIFKNYSTVIDDNGIRNVAEELQATTEAINWAIKQGYSQVQIHYNYEGIEK